MAFALAALSIVNMESGCNTTLRKIEEELYQSQQNPCPIIAHIVPLLCDKDVISFVLHEANIDAHNLAKRFCISTG